MRDQDKTKEQLIDELTALQQRIAEMDTSEDERVQAEKALRESEKRFRTIFEQAAVGVTLTASKTGKFVDINQKYCDIIGYDAEELRHLEFQELSHPDDLQADLDNMKRLLSGEIREYSIEKRHYRKDGSTAWINLTISPLWNVDEEPNYHIAIIQDITERKQAEEVIRKFDAELEQKITDRTAELAQVNERLQKEVGERKQVEMALKAQLNLNEQILQTMLNGFILTDIEGQILKTNPTYCTLVGYSEAELRQMHVGDLEVNISPTEIERRMAQMIGQGVDRFDTQHQHKNGRVIDLDVSSVMMQTDEAPMVATFVNDITQRKQLEEETVRQERLAAVGQLAAGIAHDFNNILTSILGFAELMQMSPDTPEWMQPDLQRISVSSQRAAHLVRQLLDFSRKTIRDPKQFDLTSLAQETIAFLERIIPENIRINLNLEPGSHLIEADPTQLQQVTTNLVINARDAMPSGGKLEIALSRIKMVDQENCVICGQAIKGEWVGLTVSDTGSGITADILPKIFEPFFTTKKVDEGTGLGLSQVYGIISQHAGHITINSQIDQGTTITIYLPLVSKQNAKMAKETSPTMPPGHGETILLVEDEPSVLETSQAMLKHLGYQVVTAVNGREALAIYRRHRTEIDLVLSDVVMPEMTGEELFHALKAENSNIRIVMISGYPLAENEAELLEKGIVAWVQKPISFGALSQVVDKALSKQ